METEEKIDKILEYADVHPSFDTGFIESLQEFLGEKGYLTAGQEDALDNIIDRFRIA
jgi:hypothetical protein